MESNYSNRDFEQFVKQNADEYRMFPSEKVWNGVHNALHTRRRWTGFGLAFLLLLTGGAVSWVMTMYPVSKKSQDITSVESSKTNTTGSTTPADQPGVQPTETKEPRHIHGILPFNKETEENIDVKVAAIPAPSSAEPGLLRPAFPAEIAPVVPEYQQTIERVEKSAPAPIHTAHVKDADPAGTTAVRITATETLSSPVVNETAAVTDNRAAMPAGFTEEPPLTIESVINSYKFQRIPKKISWQLFITPTVSYRKLGVNKGFNNVTGTGYPFSPALSDVNEAVTHKPDLGLQLGFTARYPLSNSINLRAGFQFNVNRYDIKAFTYTGEMATIGLNSPTPGSSSVSAYTRYRNYSGYKADWLKNFYYSVSLPIGAELKVFGNNKTSFGIAGTIQPTYVISDGAYLLSTDYKNYAKVPWLTRNFNMNTGFEAFVNYTRGKTRWQVGPQFRYQLLSSFENKYPVKENLFDFGLKVGVTLNQ
ncbi:MAG: hypothetical protein J0I32_02720 [Sphingobacteriales bacterium]|nr:hypothetical protein [Sphingobacteriales bacterium]OJW04926.1 MAG: hypothetical protein BGO52_20780 [Sphingobacteriales bacterium 44-61]